MQTYVHKSAPQANICQLEGATGNTRPVEGATGKYMSIRRGYRQTLCPREGATGKHMSIRRGYR